MAYTYDHPRPSVTVDCILFGFDAANPLKVLLVRRQQQPFADNWALPGGFVAMEEGLDAAAVRELYEETGIKDVAMEQLYTFGQPGRDPRGRVISVGYYSLINLHKYLLKAGHDVVDASWFCLEALPELAFDHTQIIQLALHRLRAKVRYQPIGIDLLPEKFTLTQLQSLYEKILGSDAVSRRNFQSRILKMGILKDAGKQKGVSHRPAKLYAFDKKRYEKCIRERDGDLFGRHLASEQ